MVQRYSDKSQKQSQEKSQKHKNAAGLESNKFRIEGSRRDSLKTFFKNFLKSRKDRLLNMDEFIRRLGEKNQSYLSRKLSKNGISDKLQGNKSCTKKEEAVQERK